MKKRHSDIFSPKQSGLHSPRRQDGISFFCLEMVPFRAGLPDFSWYNTTKRVINTN
jgi:hypothetical protein